jgi:tRNA dimethylallyltransferase
MPQPKIIAIVGPTASGKTSLGIFLAKKFKGEVISADSRQVYRGLDIGTGKVTKKEMAGVPHHLLDVVSPKKVFTADNFVQLGTKAIEKIIKNNHVPVIVGGTGFYIDALLGRMTLANVPPNPKLRAKLKKKSATQLFAMLKKLDSERAKNIDSKNPVRLIRAIEIATELSKKNSEGGSSARLARGSSKFSAENLSTPDRLLFTKEILWLGINPGKEKLQKNIHDRLLARMKLGMVAEARRLHTQGLSYARMEALGLEYRSLARLLQNNITKEDFLVELERAINQYAKRQMTWFKRNKEIHWVKTKPEALRLAKEFLKS